MTSTFGEVVPVPRNRAFDGDRDGRGRQAELACDSRRIDHKRRCELVHHLHAGPRGGDEQPDQAHHERRHRADSHSDAKDSTSLLDHLTLRSARGMRGNPDLTEGFVVRAQRGRREADVLDIREGMGHLRRTTELRRLAGGKRGGL